MFARRAKAGLSSFRFGTTLRVVGRRGQSAAPSYKQLEVAIQGHLATRYRVDIRLTDVAMGDVSRWFAEGVRG